MFLYVLQICNIPEYTAIAKSVVFITTVSPTSAKSVGSFTIIFAIKYAIAIINMSNILSITFLYFFIVFNGFAPLFIHLKI